MIIKTATSLAFAAAFLTAVTAMPTAHARTHQGDKSHHWSARQNVVQSERYDRLLETNRAFRMARMHKECGPISDSQLRGGCLASFAQDEPYVGSSTSPRHYRSNAGG